MARAFYRKESKKRPFGLSYNDPLGKPNNRVQFATADERDEELARWNLIEIYFKTNNPQWRKLYEENNTIPNINHNNLLYKKAASQLRLQRNKKIQSKSNIITNTFNQ